MARGTLCALALSKTNILVTRKERLEICVLAKHQICSAAKLYKVAEAIMQTLS